MIFKNISIEKKILAGYVFSLVLIIVLGFYLYVSKIVLHKQTLLIKTNNEIRLHVNNVVDALNKLEVERLRYLLENEKGDSLEYQKYFNNFNIEFRKLEEYLKKEKIIDSYFDSVKNKIITDLSGLTYKYPISLYRHKQTLNILKNEKAVFYNLITYLKSTDEQYKLKNLKEVSIYYDKIKRSQQYFFLLTITILIIITFYFFTLLHDTKERKTLYRELEESRNELRTIMNTIPALIFVKNKEKRFISVNKYFLDFFCITEKEILNKNNSEVLNSNKFIKSDAQWLIYEEEDEAVINNRISITDIEQEFHVRGNHYWLNKNVAPLITKEGNVKGLVGVMYDITQKNYFQNSLITAIKKLEELNKEKNTFFSIIAHDLRSPFTGLIGFSDLLINEFDIFTNEEKKELLFNMNNSIHSIWAILNNLLEWSRIQFEKVNFSPSYIYLRPVINTIFKVFCISSESKQIELKNSCSSELKIYADENMLETIIRNLVNNSIKYTNPGGFVEVWAKDSKNGTLISIIDNGIGMEKETADNLFNMNVKESRKGTADEKGTGLGLLICEEFIRKHKSFFTVESEVNKGTRISFLLPHLKEENQVYNHLTEV